MGWRGLPSWTKGVASFKFGNSTLDFNPSISWVSVLASITV